MSFFFRIVLLLPLALLLGMPSTAMARRKVAVLKIVGENGEPARRVLVRALKRYDVLGAMAVPNACKELGIPMTKGQNLAECAQQVGAVAVVGGAARGRSLILIVFSGKTGQVMLKRKLRWGRYPTRSMARALLTALLGTVKRAPRLPRKRPDPPPTPAAPAPSGSDEPAAPLTFSPEDVNRGAKTPPKVAASPEDPLSLPDGGDDKEDDSLPGDKKPPDPKPREETSSWFPRRPRLAGTLGLGTWLRSFSINQPARESWASSYSSGATFTMKLGLEAFPVAFLLDNFAQDVLLRFSFQTAIGLSSGIAGKASSGLSTSMNEWNLELGYRWNVLKKLLGPEVEATLGFGGTAFSIDWAEEEKSLPDASYSYFALGVGGTYRFLPNLGGHLRFAYRFASADGVTADEAPGYGPASLGGINLAVGVHGDWKGFVGSFEYVFTHYFYSFTDISARKDAVKPAAGGALDQFHAVMIGVGYSL